MDLQQTCTMNRRPRARLSLLGIVCGVGLCVTSCGGDSDTPSSPTRVSTPTPRLVQQGSFPLRAPEQDGVYFQLSTITDASAGLWEATVDWTNQANTLWMWVANGVCAVDQFARDECPFDATCPCQFAVRSELATPKPRVLSIPGAPGGTRTLIVMNLGPQADTATYRVMLTPTALGASSTSPDPVAGLAIMGKKAVPRR